MRQWPKQKMHRHLVSPMGVLLCSNSATFLDLFKVSKNTKKPLSKGAAIQKQPSKQAAIEKQPSNVCKMTYGMFKVSKMIILIMTCSKSAK